MRQAAVRRAAAASTRATAARSRSASSGSERPRQRFRRGLAVAARDHGSANTAGERLRRSVAAQGDTATHAAPAAARPGDLKARRDLANRFDPPAQEAHLLTRCARLQLAYASRQRRDRLLERLQALMLDAGARADRQCPLPGAQPRSAIGT